MNEISLYLPKHLSPEQHDKLYSNVVDFPQNIDAGRYYGSYGIDPSIIYQGDGLEGLKIIDFDTKETFESPCLIISNTCDADLKNKRMIPSHIIYAPIIQVKKYMEMLKRREISEEIRNGHIDAIRKQMITQIFYLPEFNFPESIVFLDRIQACPNNLVDRENLESVRRFSLSQYGHYTFLYKISMHFCRMNDGVVRG